MESAFEDVRLDDKEDSDRRGGGAGTATSRGGVTSPSAKGTQVLTPSSSKDRGSGAGGEESENQGEGGSSSDAPIVGGSIVGDVLYSIATGEEEGKSRQRILAFAAKRYQTAVDKNPKDYDALYNWALVLQESADNCGPEVGLAGKDALLEEACQKYDGATALCPTLHEAFYNWAIAVSDRAKIRGRTAEAEALWRAACDKYERAVQLNWDSPQALNNWGLALQELGNIVPAREKRGVVRKAINKFRTAIRLRWDFHRAIYNLGTVLYGLAEDTAKHEKRTSASSTPVDPAHPPLHQELYSQSAVYIASAHSLKHDYPVYRNALRLVRTMLPLPYLKAGFLTVPPGGNTFAPHSEWRRKWFVLDHEELKEGKKPEPKLSSLMTRTRTPSAAAAATAAAAGNAQPGTPGSAAAAHVSATASISFLPAAPAPAGPPLSPKSAAAAAAAAEGEEPLVVFPINAVVSVETCADLSLPRGGGIVLGLPSGPTYLVADDWDAMDSWVDAIRLVYTIHVRGMAEELSSVLAG